MKILKYSIIMLAVLMMASCHKDDPGTTTQGETPVHQPEVIKAVNGDILGYVYDEDNNPVANAQVNVLSESTTTDQYGVFKFKNIELDEAGTYVKVTKSGYILGSDFVTGAEGVNRTSRVKMMKLDVSGSFSAAAGGVVNVKGGGEVTFAPESIVKADGSAYTGTVNVTAKRLATDDPNMADLMPGGLLADDAEGRTVTLGSMGMVAVELRDGSGNELNIATSKTADITFPIADFQKAEAPNEIKLWSFDENMGRWQEEGMAVKDGDVYKATVSHFSFWNCDAPFPLVEICGKVVYSDGSPASNLYILILTDLYGCGYGWTNEDGTFMGKVPKNQILTIQIKNILCNGEESLVEIEVGPFDTKTVLDDIILDLPTAFSFEGQVLCGADPVNNATVLYSFNGNTYTVESTEDGSFVLNIADDCSDLDQVTVFAIDPTTGNASATVTLMANDPDFVLQVCNDCGFTVSIVPDPASDICEERRIIAEASGSGPYFYQWSTGSSDSSIEANDSGLYCVTVSESDECFRVQCLDLNGWRALNGELGSNSDCDSDGGFIYTFINGGNPPYTYDWSDPSLTVINDSIVENVPAGDYFLTVTDSEGCTKEFDITVESGDALTVDLTFEPLCQQGNITATVIGGSGQYQYVWNTPNGGQGPTTWIWADGTYCVTVFDELGCSKEACIDVVLEDFLADVIVDVSDCNQGTYTITNFSAVDVEVNFWYGGDNYTIPQGGSADIDFLTDGFYNVTGWWYSETLGCEGDGINLDLSYLLNQDTSITTYDIVYPSCEDCEDGTISTNEVYLDFNSINGALAEDILVLDADYNDVTMEAAAGTLTNGTYYVVVTDQNTGCYVYSEKLIL